MQLDTATLLPRILDHPLVKAYREGRGWLTTECDCSVYSNPVQMKKCRGCKTAIVTRYTGPDLAAESNLHELLALADAEGPYGVSEGWEWAGTSGDYYKRAFCKIHVEEDGFILGHGPTRTLAVLAALGRALNIKEGNDND